jgi:hypothetical protein
MDEAILKQVKGEAAVKALRAPPTHDEMLMRRARATSEEQTALAPQEHQAYAREFMEKHPIVGGPFFTAAIPGYQIAKALRLMPTDAHSTPPSLEQAAGGYRGMVEGYNNVLDKLRRRMLPGVE